MIDDLDLPPFARGLEKPRPAKLPNPKARKSPPYRPSATTRAAFADLARCRGLSDFVALRHAWSGSPW